MSRYLFLICLQIGITIEVQAQWNDSAKVLTSPLFSSFDLGIEFPPLVSETQMDAFLYGEVFGVNRWYLLPNEYGFQVSAGLMVYNSDAPVFTNLWMEHIGYNMDSYNASFYGNRATLSLKAGPTYRLLEIGNLQSHGFALYVLNVRRWRIRKHLARVDELTPLKGVFENNDIYRDLYYSSAKLTSPFHHLRIGMTSLFPLFKSSCSFAFWMELHPPRSYRYEIQEIASHEGLYKLELHRSDVQLGIGAGIKFHDFTGWNFIKSAF